MWKIFNDKKLSIYGIFMHVHMPFFYMHLCHLVTFLFLFSTANVKDWSSVVVAYEPVWAIGTGKSSIHQCIFVLLFARLPQKSISPIREDGHASAGRRGAPILEEMADGECIWQCGYEHQDYLWRSVLWLTDIPWGAIFGWCLCITKFRYMTSYAVLIIGSVYYVIRILNMERFLKYQLGLIKWSLPTFLPDVLIFFRTKRSEEERSIWSKRLQTPFLDKVLSWHTHFSCVCRFGQCRKLQGPGVSVQCGRILSGWGFPQAGLCPNRERQAVIFFAVCKKQLLPTPHTIAFVVLNVHSCFHSNMEINKNIDYIR